MNRVFELRKNLKLTQDEFADYCGISRISISRYETGGEISRMSAKKIATACDVSVSFVLGEAQEKQIEPAMTVDERLVAECADLSPSDYRLQLPKHRQL